VISSFRHRGLKELFETGMRVSRPALYAVLNGTSAVTADMALRFGRLAGSVPDLYLQMQTRRDLWLAEQRLRDTLPEIEPAA
jgi:antitoxin HigA-1